MKVMLKHFLVSASSSCLCHGESVIQALLYSFMLCHLIAGDSMVFSAISRDSSFKADNDANYLVDARKNNCMLRCATLMQLDLKQKRNGEKSYSKSDLSKHKWSGPVSCSQHSHVGTCPFKVCVCCVGGGGVGGGGWGWCWH